MIFRRALGLGCLLALSGASPALAQGPTCGSITATRTSGVAPLGIVFEGHINASHPVEDPFLDLLYRWDFGNPGAGTWSEGPDRSDDKNVEYGPTTAHVYERPGTYTVTMAASDSAGRSCQRTLQVRVDDPDVVFAGTNTRCISSSGSFSGCPAGADRHTSSDFDAAVGYCRQANRRCLFRAGESFTASSGVGMSFNGPSSIGTFGGTAKANVQSGAFNLFRFEDPSTDHRVWGLHVTNGTDANVTEFDSCFKGDTGGCDRVHDILIHKVSGTGGTGFKKTWQHGNTMKRGIVVSESSHRNAKGIVLVVTGERQAVIGSAFRTTTFQSLSRYPFLRRSVFAHNEFADPEQACFKMHNVMWWGCKGNCTAGQFYTEENLITENVFEASADPVTHVWCLSLMPQNDNNEERLRRHRIEGNLFRFGDPGHQTGLNIDAHDVVVRNNMCRLDNRGRACISVSDKDRVFPPANVRIMNTSCYNAGPNNIACVNFGSGGSTGTCQNTLEFSPNASTATCDGTASTTGGSVSASSNPFVSSDPRNKADFQLKAGSPAGVDAGVDAALSWDAAYRTRPPGEFDAGAWERDVLNGAPPPPPQDTTPPAAPILLAP